MFLKMKARDQDQKGPDKVLRNKEGQDSRKCSHGSQGEGFVYAVSALCFQRRAEG